MLLLAKALPSILAAAGIVANANQANAARLRALSNEEPASLKFVADDGSMSLPTASLIEETDAAWDGSWGGWDDDEWGGEDTATTTTSEKPLHGLGDWLDWWPKGTKPTSPPHNPKPTEGPADPTVLVIDNQYRCGVDDTAARMLCGAVCTSHSDCDQGEQCFVQWDNYCGSIAKRTYTNPVISNVTSRCGETMLRAETFCGEPCVYDGQCTTGGESCFSLNKNYCGSNYTEDI